LPIVSSKRTTSPTGLFSYEFVDEVCLLIFHCVWPSGKLHRHIVQLQFSEATAVRQLEAAQKKLTRLEAQLLHGEQNMDEKDRTIYHNRLEARNKIHHLKHTIQVSSQHY